MEAAQLAVRIAQTLIFGALGLISVRRWEAHRDAAAKWWAITVGMLGGVVAASFLIPPHSDSDLASWGRKVLVAILLLFPYALFRYGACFVRPSMVPHRMAQVVTGGVIVWTFLLPSLEGPAAPRPAEVKLFTLAVLVQWTALSVITTVRLWLVGHRQASVAKRRMRTMSAGTALLNVALAIVVFSPTRAPGSGWPVFTGLITIVAALCFFVGFIPPRWLRMLWRAPDVDRLRTAELGLMTAVDPKQIGDALLPHVTALFGAQGSVLLDRAGEPVASSGLLGSEVKAAAALAVKADEEPVVEQGLIAVKMRNGWLAVRGTSLSPFFGRDEIDLLTGLALFADLALERAELFASERDARQQSERANAELETFVYSVSHDLKSPLVSLLGFLDCLNAEIDGSLSDEGAFYLSRISASSLYMKALIQDLLELSRIGRAQTEAVDVALDDLLRDIVDDNRVAASHAVIDVLPLPVVSMNPLRARQLFTNLVDNAVAYSGRADVTVTVDAMDAPDGGVVVSVSDNGKGIPAEYREKVFGVFERLERQESGSQGTGIGLAVCRKIVEQCGGHIDISDNRPGARFSIRFPAAVVVARAAKSVEAVR